MSSGSPSLPKTVTVQPVAAIAAMSDCLAATHECNSQVCREHSGATILVSSSDDVSTVLHVIPQYETIEISAAGKEDTSLGGLCQSMREANILLAL